MTALKFHRTEVILTKWKTDTCNGHIEMLGTKRRKNEPVSFAQCLCPHALIREQMNGF